MPRYHPHHFHHVHHHVHHHEPPYARLENAKDEEESEEGYETIPASEQRLQGQSTPLIDPGYESVTGNADKRSEPGYETVPSASQSTLGPK